MLRKTKFWFEGVGVAEGGVDGKEEIGEEGGLGQLGGGKYGCCGRSSVDLWARYGFDEICICHAWCSTMLMS